ncbi:Lrp/AsnC family transcriptional regulator [Thermococcus sp.]|uniref:Lrp/AsnC family transcriptional regulator n=1 Tax=Thermococcus sp. TaxID=35749 RepID=UPI002619DD2C|nr:Lrp/AsnC family transcriptional regulator [Thermococcus sp.]
MPRVDDKDRELLRILRENGRITLTELGKLLNLSPASVKNRLEKLERLGAIRGYSAVVDPAFLDEFISALLSLRFEHFDEALRIELRKVASLKNVEFLYVKTGDYQVIMKATFEDMDALRRFIERLKALFGRNLKFIEVNLIEEELKDCWVAYEEASRH